MTTKTLKEWLDEQEAKARQWDEDNGFDYEINPAISALRAFDEMHGIEMVLDYDSANLERADYPQCATCQEGVHPCPTRVKVETAVGLI